MTRPHYLVIAAAIALFSSWSLGIPAQAADDPHHPAGEPAVHGAEPITPSAATPGTGAQSGMMGGQQGMMGGMSPNMMSMMQMMQMMASGDAPGMSMVDHVEGRIAFLRTELKITDAQTAVWNAFAAALRTNAQALGAARGAMMGQMRGGQPQTQTLAQRLDAQERWLTARLDGTRAIKTAFTKLYDVLSQDQKKAADELLAPQMGMGMAMIPAGMGSQMGR